MREGERERARQHTHNAKKYLIKIYGATPGCSHPKTTTWRPNGRRNRETETDIQADRQTGRQTDRWIDRQSVRQAGRPHQQSGKWQTMTPFIASSP